MSSVRTRTRRHLLAAGTFPGPFPRLVSLTGSARRCLPCALPPAPKPETSADPTGIAAQSASREHKAAVEFAMRIARARRDALRDPAQAAMLLRSWMSDHD